MQPGDGRKEKMMDTLSLPVFSLRRIETPYERSPGYRNWVAVIDVRHLPDLSKWRKINVRDPKLRGRVPNKIRQSFDEAPPEFLFRNRGLVITAHKVEYQEKSGREKIMKLTLRDSDLHGLLDGGHTYKVVTEAQKFYGDDDERRYVRLEIITGFDGDGISELVEGRNTSNQVKDESLHNHRHKFDAIKDLLNGKPYSDLIAWSEYEETADGKPKPIDVREIISYLIMFDTVAYNSTKQPLIAYKDKRACLKHFVENEKRLRKFYKLLPDILLLWDEIHERWRDWYARERKAVAGIHGRAGGLSGVVPKAKQQLYFKDKSIEDRIPDAYKYPVLSAMRAAIKNQGRGVRWASDPTKLLETVGAKLVGVVGNAVRTYHDPNKVGKDVGTWSSCYLIVESALRDTEVVQHEQRIHQLEEELEQLKRERA